MKEVSTMQEESKTGQGRRMHVVTLECKDTESAKQCLDALASQGRKDAMEFNCLAYDFGLREGTPSTIQLVERWNSWDDLDALLTNKVIPALPHYNALLKRPFDPARDTLRIRLVD